MSVSTTQIRECVRQTAEAHGLPEKGVVQALRDDPLIEKAYGMRVLTDREDMFVSPEDREAFVKGLEAELVTIQPVRDERCLSEDDLLEHLRMEWTLGKGSFGTDYSGCTPLRRERRSLRGFHVGCSARMHYYILFSPKEKRPTRSN